MLESPNPLVHVALFTHGDPPNMYKGCMTYAVLGDIIAYVKDRGAIVSTSSTNAGLIAKVFYSQPLLEAIKVLVENDPYFTAEKALFVGPHGAHRINDQTFLGLSCRHVWHAELLALQAYTGLI